MTWSCLTVIISSEEFMQLLTLVVLTICVIVFHLPNGGFQYFCLYCEGYDVIWFVSLFILLK